MSETTKLMNFEEFRTATGEHLEAVRQQQEFFRDDTAADEIRRPGAIYMSGWTKWPDEIYVPVPDLG